MDDVGKADKKDRFQSWVAHMDDAIDSFLAAMPDDVRGQLDGSPQSLAALESVLLSRYADVAAAKQPSQAQFVDGAARYVGEILRKASGSRWTIDLGDPKFAFHGLPILAGGTLGSMPACPLTMVTASLDRRTGRYLSTIVSNFMA